MASFGQRLASNLPQKKKKQTREHLHFYALPCAKLFKSVCVVIECDRVYSEGSAPTSAGPAPVSMLLCGCVVLHVGLWNVEPFSASLVAGGLDWRSERSGYQAGSGVTQGSLECAIFIRFRQREQHLIARANFFFFFFWH